MFLASVECLWLSTCKCKINDQIMPVCHIIIAESVYKILH